MRFETIIRGGRLVDPAADIDDIRDIGIVGGRVAAIEPRLPDDASPEIIDATGRIVTPGLIDLHTHVFWGRDFFGVDADSIAWRSGVTTWVDAGSMGAFQLPAFREFIVRPAQVRILSFINISYLGLAGLNYDEYCNPAACDVPLLTRVAGSAPDLVLGIKTRMGKEGVCYPGLEPLRKAVEASEATGLPIMCHISESPPEVEEVLELLRPGDIVTHAYTGGGERLIDEEGQVRASARRARDRGVLFDIGHGAGSFSFRSAEALAATGFWPDTISTDLHQVSLPGPNLVADQELIARVQGDGSPQFTLLTVLTKFLYLGWALPDVIRAVTARPAELLGMAGTIGTLRPGAQADIAILDLVERPVELFDIFKERRSYDRTLECVDTLVAGRPMTRKPMPPAPPWIRLIDLEPGAVAADEART